MGDKIYYQDDARRRILEGAKILYDAVKTTLGPKGHNVVIGKGYPPTVTHDGVTVARNIEIDVVDEETLGHKIGADLIKEASEKMNDAAGDGTTTVTILTYHLLNEANKLIAAGHSPMTLRRELEAAGEEARNLIVGTDAKGKLSQVAFISAADKAIGDMVASTVEAIGREGVVTIQPSQEIDTKATIVDGFTLPHGMQSPYFTINTTKGESELDNPGILVLGDRINDMTELMPVLETLVNDNKRPLLLIAEEVGADVLANLILNKMKGIFTSVVVCVGYQRQYLRDVAAVTGATMFGKEWGTSLPDFTPEDLGSAKQAIVRKAETVIIEGAGDPADLIKELDASVKDSANKYEQEALSKRRAALEGKVAIIKVGGATESEIKELTYRIEDAVAAVKAALEEGITLGGGVTLLNVAKQLKADTQGAKLLVNALQQPFRILLENADLEPATYIGHLKDGEGVNVNTLKIVNLMKAGVIDPAAVTKRAIQNAVSVAGTAMTVGALIVPIPKADDGDKRTGL